MSNDPSFLSGFFLDVLFLTRNVEFTFKFPGFYPFVSTKAISVIYMFCI